MRIGRGGATLLALAVFLAGLAVAPAVAHAQDRDAAPPVYVTPDSDHSAKPLFLRKLFGTDSPNAGMGKPRPYDFSNRNAPARNNDASAQEVNEQFYRQLAEDTARITANFEQNHRAAVAAGDQDRQRAYAVLAQIRASSAAASQAAARAPRATPNNIARPHSKKERQTRGSGTRAHNPSGEAPPIYVQH